MANSYIEAIVEAYKLSGYTPPNLRKPKKQWECPNCGSTIVRAEKWKYPRSGHSDVWICMGWDCGKCYTKQEIRAMMGHQVDGSKKDEETPILPPPSIVDDEWEVLDGGLWRRKVKCVCGGDASGVGTHSDWCPKYRNYK